MQLAQLFSPFKLVIQAAAILTMYNSEIIGELRERHDLRPGGNGYEQTILIFNQLYLRLLVMDHK